MFLYQVHTAVKNERMNGNENQSHDKHNSILPPNSINDYLINLCVNNLINQIIE